MPGNRGSPFSEESEEEGGGGGETGVSVEESDTRGATAAIDRRLQKPWRTKRRIGRCFRRFATDTNADGSKALSLRQATAMVAELAQELDVPPWLFKNMPELYERFDFDGDGLLEKYEAAKLVKYVLRQQRTTLGGRVEEISVPYSTLAERGFTVLGELGRGGQGAMYLCSKQMETHRYCVKFYSKEQANACGLHELIDEYALMKELKNDHIAQTYQVFQDREFYYLVNEPYFGGDFTKLAKRAHDQGVNMSEAWWRGIFQQCLEGLAYLHRKAIMHCDIKEGNIMIASKDSYAAPCPVLIDFGLSIPFSKAGSGISGTPGYIPPETWATGAWYPRGDIFSMGVTFFQLMVGQVPSSTGSVMGVLQPAADPELLRQAGLQAALPWERFPADMPELQDLVASMTNRQMAERPRAPHALQHEWFSSDSDARLPRASLQGLLGSSAGHHLAEHIVHSLVAEHNLDELRGMREDMDGSPKTGSARAFKNAAKRIKSLLKLPGSDGDTDRAHRRLRRLLDEAIWAKRHYSHNYIKDLFDELDTDGTGTLSARELEVMLDSDSFECPYHDIRDLMAQIGVDPDGTVSFENFKRAILEDGRIAKRSDVEGSRYSCALA